MKLERILIIVLALALMLTLGVRLGQAQVLGPGAPQMQVANAPAAAMGDTIPIQGRLTDASGNAVPNGNYNMTFKIYDDPTVGIPLCTSAHTGVNAVAVSNGLFSTTITGCSDADLSGDQLYLSITVGADAEMSPRQSIGSVPYARSLRPGADIHGEVSGSALYVINQSVSGLAHGVRSVANSTIAYGGYFENATATTSGGALYANGDAKQSRTGDGLVKAGVYAFCSSIDNTIGRSFNNVNTTAITVTSGAAVGECTINFGFDISDRYVVATAVVIGNANRIVSASFTTNNNELNFRRGDETGAGANGQIMVLIY